MFEKSKHARDQERGRMVMHYRPESSSLAGARSPGRQRRFSSPLYRCAYL